MGDTVDAVPLDFAPESDSLDAAPDRGKGKSSSFREGSVPEPVEFSDFWSDRYKMNHDERGVAVIINNKNFEKRTGLGTRSGTDVDASKMYSLYETLGFEEIIHENDLSAKQMKTLLQSVAEKTDFRNKDCFSCTILSHGDEGYVFGTDDKVDIEDLVSPFKGNKCKDLAGKPKLFFIQACRGQKLDGGTDAHDGESGEHVDVRRIPVEADVLITYSVTAGYFSWRNSSRGSWFIQALTEIISRDWEKLELMSMLTRVNKKVAFEFESDTSEPGMSGKKQIPCITSMLTKDVFFHK